jgi:hypothetical protein
MLSLRVVGALSAQRHLTPASDDSERADRPRADFYLVMAEQSPKEAGAGAVALVQSARRRVVRGMPAFVRITGA